jgi:hypothetical protein
VSLIRSNFKTASATAVDFPSTELSATVAPSSHGLLAGDSSAVNEGVHSGIALSCGAELAGTEARVKRVPRKRRTDFMMI